MMLRRAGLLAVGDWVRLEVTGTRVLWQVARVERPIDAAGRPELEVTLGRPREDAPFAFRCFLDDLIEIMPQPIDIDMRGRT
jgi:hypothetical protein